MAETSTIRDKINFFTLFWLFLIGSMGGIVAEGVWNVIKHGYWENHPATLWGPFCIIYGIGLVAVYIVSCFLEDKNVVVKFVSFAVAGSLVEYIGSWFQEVVLGSVSWDYSADSFNIGGRVSLWMTLLWGLLGTAFMYLLYPAVKVLLEKLKGKFSQNLTIFLAVLMVIDLAVTTVVMLRWRDRVHDIPPKNQIEERIDEKYDNERMEKRFPKIDIINE